MASRCRRYRARRLKALGHDPQLLVIRPAPPATSFDHLKPFKLSTALLAVHKDCYAPIGLIQQGGPRRRETFNDKIAVLDEEIGRMRAQRLRLERHQRKHHQERHATPTARNVIRLGSWYRAYSGFCAHKPVALRRGLGTKPGCIAAATLRTGSRPPIGSRNGARIDSFS